MSWHFLPELAADFWLPACSAGERAAPSSSTGFAERGCSSASAKGTYRPFRSGTTSERSTERHGPDGLMSSRAAFPAKTSAQQTEVPAAFPANNLACGSSFSASCPRCAPHGPLSRTRRSSGGAGLTRSYEALPISGLLFAGKFSARPRSTRRINANESGSLLPTPTAAGNEHSPSMAKWPAHQRLQALLSGCGGPQASFREWLMGWPIGWTDVAPLVTARFQEWLRWHSSDLAATCAQR